MQPQVTPTQPVWTELTGTILPGGYELKDLIEADESTAQFRVRVLGDRDLDAIAQFVQVSQEENDRLVGTWDLIRTLRHPNLTYPLGSGSWERENLEFAYVVLRRADEALESALRDRPLTTPEAKEVVASLVRGLETLHSNGLVHGALSPEQVLAVGDSIQLSITSVRQTGHTPELSLVHAKYLAPESIDDAAAEEGEEDGENVTPESDIWCLGATIFEALTCKEWTEESREEVGALPEPFATIAFRCLEDEAADRGTLAEVAAGLRGELRRHVRKADVAALPEEPKAKEYVAPLAGRQTPAPMTRAAAVGTPTIPAAETAIETTSSSASPVSLTRPSAEPAIPNIPAASVAATVPIRQEPVFEPTAPRPSAKPVLRPAVEQPTLRSEPAPNSTPRVVRAPVAPTPSPRAADSLAARNRIWVWAGVALVFVLALLWFLRPKPSIPSAALATTPSAQQPSAPASAQPRPTAAPPASSGSGQTRVLQPDGTAIVKSSPSIRAEVPSAATPKPVMPRADEIAHRATAKTVNGDVWRVVLYTYNRQLDAERKSNDVNRRHPNLHTEVFSPNGSSGPYLVSMTADGDRTSANQMRRQAVSSGMPRDSYVQNYLK